jgi:DTW domain-containing protein YfiP
MATPSLRSVYGPSSETRASLVDLLEVEGFRPWCLTCRRPGSTCVCAQITPWAGRTKFVFLMHPKEAKKTKNGSGRMAHLGLEGSELHVGVDFTDHARVNELIEDPAYWCRLLYPDKPGVAPSAPSPPAGRVPVLFLLDGTWPCAKKMMRLSKNLHDLERLPLRVTTPSDFRIKHQPGRFCLATIEAVDLALTTLARDGFEQYDQADSERLLRPFRWMVDTEIAIAADPNRSTYRSGSGFKAPEDRVHHRSRSGRAIVYLG